MTTEYTKLCKCQGKSGRGAQQQISTTLNFNKIAVKRNRIIKIRETVQGHLWKNNSQSCQHGIFEKIIITKLY